MNRAIAIILSLVVLLASSQASAFFDQFAFSPLAPSAGRPITISFRTGVCDGVDTPVVWELQGTGNVRDLVVNGVWDQEPLFCLIATGNTAIDIGALPPGNYEVHIRLRDPLDGLGGLPSRSFGSVQFTVGQARPIPALHPSGLVVVVLFLIGGAWLNRRGTTQWDFQ